MERDPQVTEKLRKFKSNSFELHLKTIFYRGAIEPKQKQA